MGKQGRTKARQNPEQGSLPISLSLSHSLTLSFGAFGSNPDQNISVWWRPGLGRLCGISLSRVFLCLDLSQFCPRWVVCDTLSGVVTVGGKRWPESSNSEQTVETGKMMITGCRLFGLG